MYDELLKLELASEVWLVAIADVMAMLIVAKHLEETNYMSYANFERNYRFRVSIGLKLAKHKT